MNYCKMIFHKTIMLVLSALLCCSCTAITIGTTATIATITARQERSLGTVVDDNIIVAKIKNDFRKSKVKGLFFNINAKSVDGSVLLTGNALNKKIKIEAIRISWAVEGVVEVIDEIVVSEEIARDSSYIKDSSITAVVKTKALLKRKIRSGNYSIETIDKVVYIMGYTSSKEELDMILDIASRVNSVKKVICYVRIIENSEK